MVFRVVFDWTHYPPGMYDQKRNAVETGEPLHGGQDPPKRTWWICSCKSAEEAQVIAARANEIWDKSDNADVAYVLGILREEGLVPPPPVPEYIG